MALGPFIHLHLRQSMQNAALPGRPGGGIATLTQIGQLRLQVSQLGDAFIHMGDMGIEYLVDGAAIGSLQVGQIQQGAYFLLRHIQRPTVAYQAQALDMGRPIVTVVVVPALRRRQQALFFVVADRLDGRASGFRQFSDTHFKTPGGS